MYTLKLSTSYADNWRYNIMVTLAMLDSNGEQVGYHSADDSPLPVGTNSSEAPEGFVYSLDGELITQNQFIVEVVHNALRFAVPKSAKPLIGEQHVPQIAKMAELV